MTYQEYYNKLDEEFESGKPSIEPNKDRVHNATILRFMFDKSQHVYMYCGEMSVLRDKFYRQIDHALFDDASLHSCECHSLGKELKTKLRESLQDFISNDGNTLTIYVQNAPASLGTVEDWIDPSLISVGIKKGVITINKLENVMLSGIPHISYSNTGIMRMETDKITHEAMCAINAPESVMESTQTFFKTLSKSAVPLTA